MANHPDEIPTGVTYSPRFGAMCPKCGRIKVPPYSTSPWEGPLRPRYHKCPECGWKFKSVEVDFTLLQSS